MKMPHFTIRGFAVGCVAATSAYVMWMGTQLTHIIASPDWCSKALQAERISSQNFGGLTACNELLKIQLNALARGYLINTGVIALCLSVLIIIVIAGAKFSGEAPGGFKANVAPAEDEPIPVTVTNPPSNPVPTTTDTGPSMPEGEHP